MNVIDKIGLIMTKPRSAFEAILLDESRRDSYLILILVALNSSLISYSRSSNLNMINLLYSFGHYLLIWFLYIAILSFIIKRVYKVPGGFIEFLELSNYAQVAFFIVAVTSIINFLLAPYFMPKFDELISIFLLLMNGIIWWFFLHVLLYFAAKAYFKIDVAQFIVSVLISWMLLTAVLIPIFFAISLLLGVVSI
ncbi:MAG: hypothetical protein DRN78_02085 [Thermoproteota archaeon]|nr:MAG: hypothetical protein DRN78_02085 [Candidatus Korarchaeota archaeon]